MSILLEDTGTPIINPNGTLTIISGITEFKQRIINVFSTFLNSEILHPDYGFDFENLSRASTLLDKSTLLKSLAYEALNPENVYNLNEILSLEAIVTGTTGMINVSVSTLDGNIYNSEFSLGGELI